MFDLAPYRLPMQSIPRAAEEALACGVIRSDFPELERAPELLIDNPAGLPDGAYRLDDGRALVLCTTAMHDVTPAMIDWWFGWHLTQSERYQLWHPLAHRKSTCEFDRRQLDDDRARYIGNISYVDELIGPALQQLAIAFKAPDAFGFTETVLGEATAVCADTSDRVLRSTAGSLVHWVGYGKQGAVMRSGFWLGQIRCAVPLVGGMLSPLLNRPASRRLAIPDQFLLDLLRHCAEEMNHLPRFLPSLYADAHEAGVR